MKITVYFSLGDILECEDVKDSKRFWRMVSKHCKMFSYGYRYRLKPERVVKVVKTI